MRLTEDISSRSEQVRHESTSGRSEARLPDRREFFRRIGPDAITSVSSALMGKGVLEAAITPVDSGSVVGHNQSQYPCSNASIEVVPGVSFHNLGVDHTSLNFMLERRTLVGAIQQADVVLFGGFAGQTYFDNLAARAHEERKIVVRLEGGLSRIPDLALTVNPFLVIGTLTANILHLMRRLGPPREHGSEQVPTEQPSLSRALFSAFSCLLSETFRVYQLPT